MGRRGGGGGGGGGGQNSGGGDAHGGEDLFYDEADECPLYVVWCSCVVRVRFEDLMSYIFVRASSSSPTNTRPSPGHPRCLDIFDLTDQSFFPCPCGYQVGGCCVCVYFCLEATSSCFHSLLSYFVWLVFFLSGEGVASYYRLRLLVN